LLEPIRQVGGDGKREKIMAARLSEIYPWKFYSTPRFYFTDYHVTKKQDEYRENYIGDIEIKWLRSDSSKPAIFPFNKLQQLLIAPPYTDGSDCFHRICFRFSDGLLIIPARELGYLIPTWHVRWDTQERDLVVYVDANQFKRYWVNVIVNED
jgi:hypothetical protein